MKKSRKDFNNAMGKKVNRFDQPKKRKQTKPKSDVSNEAGENKYRKQQKNQQIPPHPVSEKKPAITRKPIIITKMS
jgi:hypothetical protein